jgi:hypothetical protein
MQLSISEKEKLINQYFLVGSMRRLASDFSVSRSTVQNILHKYGVFPLVKKRYSIDRSFFSTINTRERAYWLGFLLADGNINKTSSGFVLRVRLKELDLSHLQKFAVAIKYDGPVEIKSGFDKFYNRKTYKANITLCSAKLCRDLNHLGFNDLKRDGLTGIFSKIPKSLIRDLVRGMIDGDGSITYRNKSHTKYSVSFCDIHRSVVEWVVKYLNEHINTNLNKLILPVGKNCHSVIYGSNGQVRRILSHLYDDCHDEIVLDRKFRRYEMVMVMGMRMRIENSNAGTT